MPFMKRFSKKVQTTPTELAALNELSQNKENFFRTLENAISFEIKNDYQLRISADHSKGAVS